MTPPGLHVAQAPGVRITARARGAHLLSWTTHDIERLWLSPLSDVAQSGAIRGGVPVLFPQFAAFGALPKHGFARTAEWENVPVARPAAGRAELSFRLEDTAATRKVWPHPFRLSLAISASSTDLIMVLTVANPGPASAQFTGGLHTYLAVADPGASITGLAGCYEWDGRSTSDPRFSRRIDGPVRALDGQDRVIHGALAPLVLHDARLGTLRVAAEGFSHRVVWNPGPGHDLPDVAPGDEAGFVCIEPVDVLPVVLPGDGRWEARQHLSVP